MYRFLEEVASNYMTWEVQTASPDMTMRNLLMIFKRDDFNAYPVTENARVIGLVTKFDVLARFAFTPAQMVPRYENLINCSVADVMSLEFIYVSSATKLTRVLQLMVDHRIRSIPVIDTAKLTGIIAREDVMRALERCTNSDDSVARKERSTSVTAR